jgi:hypothetical protein
VSEEEGSPLLAEDEDEDDDEDEDGEGEVAKGRECGGGAVGVRSEEEPECEGFRDG